MPCAGFEQMVAEVNRSELGRRNGGNVLSAQASERALLINLLARLRTLDADVYVGHNISAFDLDVLLHRLQFHKVSQQFPLLSKPRWQAGDHLACACFTLQRWSCCDPAYAAGTACT